MKNSNFDIYQEVTDRIIAPIDCKHENYVVEPGVPSNVKQCLDCIYWEFTKENPTVE